jgi:alpha-beta hydrolase superfamily lysophospholipase
VHYTRFELAEGSPVAQLGLVHGFSECSDGWFESSFIYALNGMLVHSIDHEAYGFSSGARISGQKIDTLHYGLQSLIQRFEEGIPTFLYGNSMGCLVVNTFLLRNPDLKLAGVIFSAPFFGFADSLGVTWSRKILLRIVDPILKVSAPLIAKL